MNTATKSVVFLWAEPIDPSTCEEECSNGFPCAVQYIGAFEPDQINDAICQWRQEYINQFTEEEREELGLYDHAVDLVNKTWFDYRFFTKEYNGSNIKLRRG